MKSLTRSTSGLLAAGVAIALVVTACGGSSSGGSSAPGVTKTTVTIGSHTPLTGPAAPGYSEIAPASEAYFKYVNDHGGVNGRKIVYKFLDDAYNPSKTAAVTRQLVLQDKIFAMFTGLGTPTHSAVVDFLNAQKVPDLFVASGCACWNEPAKHPDTFGWQTPYTIEGKILGQYIAKNFAGKKVGYFYQDDDFGTDGVAGLDKYIPKNQVVAREKYVPTNTDIGPQVAALKAAGAQVVVSFSIPAFTALLRLGSVKLGFSPQFAVSNVGSDPITLTGLLKSISKGAAGGSLIEGTITTAYLTSLGDTSNSWIALFKKIHDTYDAKTPFDGNVVYGMATAATFVSALRAAGQNPTRQSLLDAVQSGQLKGPGLVPLTYNSTNHSGYDGAQIGIIKSGVIDPVGSPLVTDAAGGPITAYTAAQPGAPANG